MRQWIANLIGIGRATLVDDAGELQRVQVTEGARGTGFADRVTDEVVRISEFGFASVPPIGAEVLLLRRGGDRSHSLVVGTSHRPSRPRDLKPGDAGIYDVRGAKVMLVEDEVTIDAAGRPVRVVNATTVTLVASEKVRIEAPVTEMSGDLQVQGEVTARKGGTEAALGSLRDAYQAHRHDKVQAGTALSGRTDREA